MRRKGGGDFAFLLPPPFCFPCVLSGALHQNSRLDQNYERMLEPMSDAVGADDEAVEEVREGAGLERDHVPAAHGVHHPVVVRLYYKEYAHPVLVGDLSEDSACRVELATA